jgi:hypothetical protein
MFGHDEVIGGSVLTHSQCRGWRAFAKAVAFACGLAVSVSMVAPPARADDSVPVARQVVILMRALAYDGNLKKRAGETVNIAILRKRGHAASENTADVMAKAFGALEVSQVSGLPIVVSRLTYTGEEGLKKAVTGSGIDFVYVCEGLDTDLDAIQRVTRQLKVMSVGSSQAQVEKGLTIGVLQIQDKCTILLNLSASRLEGISFAADLLRLAKVIR